MTTAVTPQPRREQRVLLGAQRAETTDHRERLVAGVDTGHPLIVFVWP
jgi:hypothetical protein